MHWLLILTLKSILSSIIGSSFYQWFQGTTMGIWFQKKVDQYMEYFAEKYDLELAKKDAKFRKQYPLQADRLEITIDRTTDVRQVSINPIGQRWSNFSI